jgi:uncharacterized protein YukE
MNTEQVRQVSKQVDQEAHKLQNDISAIGNKICGADWRGPDREKFVADWNHQKSQVIKVCDMLRNTAKTMTKNAQEQDQTSAH